MTCRSISWRLPVKGTEGVPAPRDSGLCGLMAIAASSILASSDTTIACVTTPINSGKLPGQS